MHRQPGNPSLNVHLWLLLLLCLLIPLFNGDTTANAQETQSTWAQLKLKLDRLTEVKNQAQTAEVHVLSPTIFTQAGEALTSAQMDLDKARDIKSVGTKLKKVEDLLNQAYQNAAESRKQLPQVIQARQDAISAGAPSFAPDLFNTAEKIFNGAMKSIESKNSSEAAKKGQDAEKVYRDAELLTIKANIIGRVHELLASAKEMKADKYAPLTFAKSVKLITEAEEILNTNRTEQSAAREKAEQAEYEVNHALYLGMVVQENKKSEENWEALILNHETEMKKITDEMSVAGKFDAGFKEPVKAVLSAIQSLKQEKKSLGDEVAAKNAELRHQREEIDRLSAELAAVKESEAGLRETLEVKNRREEKFRNVMAMFAENEAIVIRENRRIIFRLVGLSFAPGKNEIDSQYAGLLTKVQMGIQTYPDATITVEGHTDSRGQDNANIQLSQKRADAVAGYLAANMGVAPDRITSKGYGKSKPITTNDTEEGRKMNRRIDVVIESAELEY
jgi:OmpA-OmpF porin, OOP family